MTVIHATVLEAMLGDLHRTRYNTFLAASKVVKVQHVTFFQQC